MFLAEQAHMLLFYGITPMHAGSGSSTGAVDLPIQRERHTQRPIVQSSGVKGALRDTCEQISPNAAELVAIFGSEGQDSTQAGALSTTDAKIFFFPVRSSHAPFLYVTCPSVLRQFVRDSKAIGLAGTEALTQIQVHPQEYLPLNETIRTSGNTTGGIVLEDMRLTVSDSDQGTGFLQEILSRIVNFEDVELLANAVIIADSDFQYLVETTCPVQSRIRIDGQTGIVATGGLFYEELLPADTLLYSVCFLSAERKAKNGLSATELNTWLHKTLPQHIQLGGDATLGRGYCELQWVSKEDK